MKWNEFIDDYLSFTRKERVGILVIVGLILITLFLPGILKRSSSNKLAQMDTAWMAAVRKLEIRVPDSTSDHYQKNNDEDAGLYQYDKRRSSYNENAIAKGELFYFDPNTISGSEWKRLGLRDKTIKTIENYLSKGGHFYNPEDLQKIYGLREDEYERLKPYIKIESNISKANDNFVSFKSKEEIQSVKTYAARYSIIDVNIADTTAFISLPGIGSKLATRIVNFRDKLGGFYSIDQIGETFVFGASAHIQNERCIHPKLIVGRFHRPKLFSVCQMADRYSFLRNVVVMDQILFGGIGYTD